MNKTEATAAIGDIEVSQNRMRARARYKGADLIYALWGIIWFIAFACQQFGGSLALDVGSASVRGAHFIWTPLVLLGIALSWLIARRREAVKDQDAWKFGVLWPIVFGYFYLWIYLLGPLFNYNLLTTDEGILHSTAVIATIPMCIYVLAGLLTGDTYIAWVGGAVTVLTGLGMCLAHDYFFLWMAVFGGGGLLVAGYISRRKWMTA